MYYEVVEKYILATEVLENEVVTIQAVRYSLAINGFVGPCGIGSTEGVEMLENAGVFGEPMEEYVEGGINKI